MILNSITTLSSESRNVEAPFIMHARVVTGHGGGPEKTIINSPRCLRLRGYEARCIYLRPPKTFDFATLSERAHMAGAELLEIDDRGPFDYQVIDQALYFCRQNRVAIWHGHDYKSNALGLLLRRWHPMRLVTTVHGWVGHTWKTPLYYAIDRYCLRRYDRVICVSDDLQDTCLKSGVKSNRCSVIENAIDLGQFSRRQTTTEAKARLGLSIDHLLIGAVGRLAEEKGFDRLIEAVAQVAKQGHRIQLVIIGDGAERSKLASLIEQRELEGCVRLVGFQADTISWYEAMDVFVLSSLREGLPNVLLEAMALETPVIATRIAGVPRLIEHQVNGILVPPDDVESLTQAILQMAFDEALRSKLRSEGRKTIENRYCFEGRMDLICKVYNEVLRDAEHE